MLKKYLQALLDTIIGKAKHDQLLGSSIRITLQTPTQASVVQEIAAPCDGFASINVWDAKDISIRNDDRSAGCGYLWGSNTNGSDFRGTVPCNKGEQIIAQWKKTEGATKVDGSIDFQPKNGTR